MLNKTFVLPMILASVSFWAEASHVRRVVMGQDDPSKTYVEDRAEYELDLKVPSVPEVVQDPTGKKFAQVLQFDVENRSGVRLPTRLLREGDLLLEPLFLIGPGENGSRVELFPSGHIIKSEDLDYVQAKSFRQIFDAGGAQIFAEALKEGDTLEAYSMGYDKFNALVFEESGFQTTSGKVIIPNGTLLLPKHIAMLNLFTPFPVRIRQSIDLDLELYLRVDWPDQVQPKKSQFWIRRAGVPQPILLFSYQIKVGDSPIVDIRTLDDRQIICEAGVSLVEKGPKNSLEILDKKKDAVMLSKNGRLINSIDPITGDPNDKNVEPGQLVLAPRNEGEYLRPFVVHNVDELNSMVTDEKYSFSRGAGAAKATFPFNAYLTQYTVPFMHDCMSGCDARLEVSDALISGEKKCPTCNRMLKFRPFVFEEIASFPFEDAVWKKSDIHCAYCSFSFDFKSAHALAGSEDGMNEFPSVELNMIHPSRLRTIRMGENAMLAKSVSFYKNGEEVVIPEGTLVDEALRLSLEARAVSPVYVSTPAGPVYDAAQCPRCFGWNAVPNHSQRLKGEFGVDEIRRGLVCFPTVQGRVNRLDFVVFGLSSQKDPISGKSLAKVLTYRRYGDEHFQQIQGWEKVSEKWEFLPRYHSEKGSRQPLPLQEGGTTSAEELFDDF